MNGTALEPTHWSRGRFLSVVAVLFVLQGGLILFFAERENRAAQSPASTSHFHLLGFALSADQLSKAFFAIDPLAFSGPTQHGFSGPVWLELAQGTFEVPGDTETPAWLTNSPEGLGTNFSMLNRPKSLLPFTMADETGSDLEPWPVFLTPQTFATESHFEIRGPLSKRQLNPPGELRVWPAASAAQLLSNSVVQIAVDSSGQVVAARLLARSGSVDADTNALGVARGLRFKPVFAKAPVWGRAIFAWQTAESTNIAGASQP